MPLRTARTRRGEAQPCRLRRQRLAWRLAAGRGPAEWSVRVLDGPAAASAASGLELRCSMPHGLQAVYVTQLAVSRLWGCAGRKLEARRRRL